MATTLSPAETRLTERLTVWGLRGLWFSLPWSAGRVIGEALEGRSVVFLDTASAGAWAGWALGLTGLLLPSAVSLVIVRTLAPAALLACCWAAAVPDPAGGAAVAAGITSVSAICVLAALPLLGGRFVDAMSYGNERRLPLRPPQAVLLGGLPITWALTLGGLTAGPLLWAAGRSLAGPLLMGLGLPAAALGARSMLGLARRWLVFVPAGVVLHDGYIAQAPTLIQSSRIACFAPAPAVRKPNDPPAHDLSFGAAGLLLELRLREPLKLHLRGAAEPQEMTSLLVAPTRPLLALDIAAERNIKLA